MSKRGCESEVVAQAGRGCDAVERERGWEAVGQTGEGRVKLQVKPVRG